MVWEMSAGGGGKLVGLGFWAYSAAEQYCPAGGPGPFQLCAGAWRCGSLNRYRKLDPLLKLNILEQKGACIENHLLVTKGKM